MRSILRLLTLLAVALPLAAQPVADSFDSNGVQIHYLDQGSGDPVVFLHGAFVSKAMWPALGYFAAVEKAGFRAIAIDLRGHGQSDKPHDPDQYGLEMSHDVARLLDHLSIERAHVVGYSMGALVANRFRAMHPDRTISAVLGGGAALREESVFVRRADEFADALARGDAGPLLTALIPPGRPQPTQEEIKAASKQRAASNDMQAVSAAIRALGFADSVDELRKNRTPTLAVVGELDPNREDVEAMALEMTALQVVVIPNRDHGGVARSPQLRAATLDFLVKNGSRR